jgi:hypothetical protein
MRLPRRFRARVRGAASAIVAALAAISAWLATAASVLAESPSPTSAPGGDPRSVGQGPGLVGDPLLAIALVLLIGLAALGATLLYVRTTGGPRRP